MSQLNVDTIRNRLGTGGPTMPSLNVTGIVTATSFVGSGANLTNLPISSSTTYTDLDNMLFG